MENQNFESFKPLSEEEEKNVVGGQWIKEIAAHNTTNIEEGKKIGESNNCPPGHSWNVELNTCAEHEPQHGIFTGANVK